MSGNSESSALKEVQALRLAGLSDNMIGALGLKAMSILPGFVRWKRVRLPNLRFRRTSTTPFLALVSTGRKETCHEAVIFLFLNNKQGRRCVAPRRVSRER